MDDATDAARLLSELREDIAALEQRKQQDAALSLLRELAFSDVDNLSITVETRGAANLTCGDNSRAPPVDEEIAFSEVNDSA